MIEIIIYTAPRCIQCEFTKRLLIDRGFQFRSIPFAESDEARALADLWGYRSAPIVIAGGTHWAGFRPDLIASLPGGREGQAAS